MTHSAATARRMGSSPDTAIIARCCGHSAGVDADAAVKLGDVFERARKGRNQAILRPVGVAGAATRLRYPPWARSFSRAAAACCTARSNHLSSSPRRGPGPSPKSRPPLHGPKAELNSATKYPTRLAARGSLPAQVHNQQALAKLQSPTVQGCQAGDAMLVRRDLG